jgi:N-acetylneuraminic acid mutarotase
MTHALEPGTGTIRRRALFGLLDADGWGWASVKAFIWLVVLILMLGYIPDRAYYIVVNRTIDVGLLAWSPINFCPPENQTLPCPAPLGTVLPWQPSPKELSLPAPRTGGSAVQLGSKVLYMGGTDGSKPVDTVYVAGLTSDGNFTAWEAGPRLPEARSGAAAAVSGGRLYLIGGTGPSGATATAWSLEVDAASGALGNWTPVTSLNLPEPRTGAAVASIADGIVLVGGADAAGHPTQTTWKSTLDAKGVPGAWVVQAPLISAAAGATAVQVGDYLWLVGGTDANGPSGAVQRGTLGTGVAPAAPGTFVNPSAPVPPQRVLQWAAANTQNLPGARADAAVFSANGSIYVAGGKDAQGARGELYWAVPNEKGDIPEWKHLAETDLPGGITGAAAFVNGPVAFLVGGSVQEGTLASSVRANLAPQEPFFQLGLVGATIPALRLEGELGQQLGMLSAAGAGTLNFAIMVAIGVLWARRPQVMAWVERRRRARRERAG